jgi:hypothetical protein
LRVEPIRWASVNAFVDDGDGDSLQARYPSTRGYAFFLAAACFPGGWGFAVDLGDAVNAALSTYLLTHPGAVRTVGGVP